MGEAKRRRLAGIYPTNTGVDPMSIPVDVQERAFNAVRRACAALGTEQGQDCSPHAWATSGILDYLNIRHNLNFGAAIICFGPGRGDLVTHCSVPDFKCQFEAGQFHAWITVWDDK